MCKKTQDFNEISGFFTFYFIILSYELIYHHNMIRYFCKYSVLFYHILKVLRKKDEDILKSEFNFKSFSFILRNIQSSKAVKVWM